MIKMVWSKIPSGDILELNLRSSDREVGLLVFNITGIGPPKATVNSSGGPNFDGVRVSSVRTDARHLLITLAVVGGGVSEEEAKKKVYTYFPIKQEILFGITTDEKSVYIPAIVEENEFNQFSKVENAAISLYCPQPYFVDMTEQRVNISPDSGVPLFEFPFHNDSGFPFWDVDHWDYSLLEQNLEFGFITDLPTANISYTGQVKTGVEFVLDIFGLVENVIITNNNGRQIMTLDFSDAEAYFGSPVMSGDRVFIDTRMGQKSAYFVRDGVWFNIINSVGIDDDWIELLPGTNMIVMNAAVGVDQMETDIHFNTLSEGV